MERFKEVGKWILDNVIVTLLTAGINILLRGKKYHQEQADKYGDRYKYPEK